MKPLNYIGIFAGCVGAVMLAQAGQGAVVTFQDGVGNDLIAGLYSGTEDNSMNELNPTLQSGTATSGVIAGSRPTGQLFHGLIRFNLAGVNVGTTVTSDATLRFTLTGGSVTNVATDVHSLLSASGGWAENTSTWALQDNSGAGTAWAGSAGASTAGVDYGAVALDSDPGGDYFLDFTIPQLLVQSWITTPSSNYGLFVKLNDETPGAGNQFVQAYFSDTASASYRPSLTFDYNPAVPEPGSLALLFSGVALLLVSRRRLSVTDA